MSTPTKYSPQRVACLAAAILSASLASPFGTARADDAATRTDIEEITVYARRLMPVMRVAAVVTSIDQQYVARNLVDDVKELVRYEPGITVRNDPLRFGLDSFSIRGLGGNRVAVEIDGIPAASGFAVGSYSDASRRFVDVAFLDRVEFLRGPASSLYGSDALAGIVAMTTVTPERLLGSDGRALAVRTEAGYANVDAGWHAAALAAGTLGPGQWLAGYSHREGHEASTAAGVTPDPRRYDSDAVLLKWVAADVPGGPLTVAYDHGRLGQQTSVDAFLGQPGRFVNTTALLGDDASRRDRVSVEQSLGSTGAFDSADWRLYWQSTSTSQDSFELRKAAPPRTPPLQIDREFRYTEDTYGVEFTGAKSFAGADRVHDVVYGIEAARTRIEERRDGLQTNLLTGSTTNVILGENLPLRDFPVSDVTEVGIFAQDEVRFGAARGWSLIPALRLDDYRLEPVVDGLYRQDNPSSTPVGLDTFSIAPKLGVVRRFDAAWSGFFQYAHGFRSPPPEDVNIGLELPLFNVRAIPNPDLEPERSDGYELGLRWIPGPAAALTASVYYNDYRNFIESKVNLGVDPATGTTLFQSQNVARARIYGAETSLTLDAGSWASRLDGWTTRFALSWARGEDVTTGEPLNSVEPATAVLGVRYDAASRRWGSELVTTAVAAKHDVDDSRVDLYETAGYVTLDWLANVDLGHGLQVNAGVFNLTDREYIEWADVQGRAANDPLVPYYTRPGRNVSITLRWTF